MAETSYLKVLFILVSALIAGTGVFNFILNPLGIYNTPVIKEFNDLSPAASTFSRIHKTEGIKRVRPEIVIIGSSRADIGLNPSDRFFYDRPAYNFGLAAATIHEQRRNFEFAVAAAPVRTAILTLDYFAFNALKLDNKQFEPARVSERALKGITPLIHKYGTLLSLDTLAVSFRHLRYTKQLDRRSYYRPNGHKVHNDGAFRARRKGAAAMFKKPPNEEEVVTSEYRFSYSDRQGDTTFRHLAAMLDLARQKNIDVVLVISPLHRTQLEILEKTGQWQNFLRWKRELTRVAEENAIRHDTDAYPLWDFATLNSITAEPVPPEGDTKTQMRWFWDTNHYKEALGDVILAKILGRTSHPSDFGVLLTGRPSWVRP